MADKIAGFELMISNKSDVAFVVFDESSGIPALVITGASVAILDIVEKIAVV